MKSVYTGDEKVAEFESYDELRVGDGKPAFIYEGNDLVYPNPVKDGLVLWYDFSGMTNNDANRGIATDLSGNGNHGTLNNFNYTSESGYDKNKLLFDGVDDFLQVPETILNPKNMAVVSNGEVFSYEGDVVKTLNVEGNLTSLIKNKIISHNLSNGFVVNTTGKLGYSTTHKVTELIEVNSGFYYTFSAEKWGNSYENLRIVFYDRNENFINSIFRTKPNPKGESFLVPENTTYLRLSVGNNVSKFMLIQSSTPQMFVPASEDYMFTNFTQSRIQDLLLYNRPLTPEEIAHNYEIEKERFGIE